MLKLTTDRATMKDAVTIARRAVGRRVHLPGLSGILLETDAEAGTLTLSATDLEHTVRVTIPADVASDGRTLIDSRALADVVSSGDASCTLVDDSERVTVGAASLRPMVVDDFPILPEVDATPATLTAGDLETIGRVRHAASTDDARPVLTGVMFGDGGQVAATDSYRLMWGEVAAAAPLSGQLVPARTLAEVARWKGGRDVAAGQHDGTGGRYQSVTFRGEHVAGPKRAPRVCTVVLTARTIEGAFPNYLALIPDVHEARWTVDAAELETAARAAARFVAKHPNVPTMLEYIDGSAGGLHLTTSAQELGETTADVLVGLLPGEPGPIAAAYNPRYLADAVAAAAGPDGRVTVDQRDALKPAVLHSDGPVSALLMPMRVG